MFIITQIYLYVNSIIMYIVNSTTGMHNPVMNKSNLFLTCPLTINKIDTNKTKYDITNILIHLTIINLL